MSLCNRLLFGPYDGARVNSLLILDFGFFFPLPTLLPITEIVRLWLSLLSCAFGILEEIQLVR